MSQTTADAMPKRGGAGAFSRFERMVALRYLRSRRADSSVSLIAVIAFLAITLGVAVLIIVMSVMNGFRVELFSKILGLNGHIMVQSANGELTNYDALAAKVKAIPGVVRVTPIVEGEVLASGRGGNTGALVRGIRPTDLMALSAISNTLRDNQSVDEAPPILPGGPRQALSDKDRQKIMSANVLKAFEGDNAVIIGVGMADHLGVSVGDVVRLTSPNGAQTPFGITPRLKAYKVVGLFQMGMSEYDSRVIFMPLDAAQEYFNLDTDNAVTGLQVMANTPDDVDGLRTPIVEATGGDQVVDWKQLNNSFFSALEVERNVMFLILTLIILVAALNIVSGLIMFVKEKGHDIAILRTMGASSGAIMRIFFAAGASIGVLGTLGGLALGWLVCANIENLRQALQKATGTTIFDPTIYFLSHLPARMDPHEIFAVVVTTLAVSFLVTLYPSWRAARLDPVEALRYE